MTASAIASEKLPRPRADDPSPGQDAWMRFFEVPVLWDKPLTSPHTLSWTQEGAPVEGKRCARAAAYERTAAYP
jgi:hypothetical protein